MPLLAFDDCMSKSKVEAYCNLGGTPNDLVAPWGSYPASILAMSAPKMSIFEAALAVEAEDCIVFLLEHGGVDRSTLARAMDNHASNKLFPLLDHHLANGHVYHQPHKQARLVKVRGPGMPVGDCSSIHRIKAYLQENEGASANDDAIQSPQLTVFESAVYLQARLAVQYMLALGDHDLARRVDTQVLAKALQLPSGSQFLPLIRDALQRRETARVEQEAAVAEMASDAQLGHEDEQPQPQVQVFAGRDCRNLQIVKDYLANGGTVNDLVKWEGMNKTLFTWAAGFKAHDVIDFMLQKHGEEINLESLFDARDNALKQHSFKLASAIDASITKRREGYWNA